jgi:hypothetical protein
MVFSFPQDRFLLECGCASLPPAARKGVICEVVL